MRRLNRPSQFQKKFSLPGFLPGLFLICSVGLLACGPAAMSVPQPSPTSSPTATPEILEKPAPIESVGIEVSAADHSQADLVVESGLPNACYTFGHYSRTREGDTFKVGILNLIPDDPKLACAEIYGMITTRIPLEGGVESCKFYEVVVNDVRHSVQAIAPNVRCAGPGNGSSSWPDEAVKLALSVKTPVDGTGLALTLIEVSEDSRCPSDVVCVWAGRATVVLRIELDSQDLGELSLSIEGGAGSASETIEGHTIELLQLEPYPVSTGHIPMEEYTARVLVARR